MRILALADEPSNRLWGDHCREALSGIDLILSAGDLPSSYLSFLTCFTTAPVVYVHGNHDDKYAQKPPEGCLCADGKVVQLKGVRILGLGGCLRYRPDAVNMYSEQEMEDRIRSLRRSLRSTGGFDILLTHSPIRGVGDQDHISHRGFECFGPLLDKYRPAVMIHGHVHQAYSAFFQRQREYHGIPVINASTSFVFDLPDTPDRKEPSRWGLRIMEKASRFE
ncbi:MAG: metallophosphoesterase family protein [Clostridia bacterium]|nr:metallophosphoesterase family protein [Clostridia bacterium]